MKAMDQKTYLSITGPIFAYFVPILWYPYFAALAAYAFIVLRRSVIVAIEEANPFAAIFIFAGIVLTHVVYGANFVIGLLRRPKLELRSVDLSTGNYLGG